MADNSIHLHLKVGVTAEKTADFKALMNELVAISEKESGTLGYEWYTTEDNLTWHIVERYADAENGDLHVKGFAENFAARFFELVDSCEAIVSDNATPYIKGVLEAVSPVYISQQGGFNRY